MKKGDNTLLLFLLSKESYLFIIKKPVPKEKCMGQVSIRIFMIEYE